MFRTNRFPSGQRTANHARFLGSTAMDVRQECSVNNERWNQTVEAIQSQRVSGYNTRYIQQRLVAISLPGGNIPTGLYNG